MARCWWSVCGACVMAVCLSTDVEALQYKAVTDAEGRLVLLAYDCGRFEGDPDCAPPFREEQKGFESGELRRLRAALDRQRFAEVWLLSGGGLLNAGIEVADELRRRSQSVRVPNLARLRAAGLTPARTQAANVTACVSSCTVAFMGGQLRFIDLEPGDEATYRVHAASAFAWPPEVSALDAGVDLWKEFLTDADGTARAIAVRSGANVPRLFRVFQDTLWLVVKGRSTGDAEYLRREQAIRAVSVQLSRHPFDYTASRQQRDRALLAVEGVSALQDILMRIERESVFAAVAAMRARLSELGRRADAALDMVEAMYRTSSILDTNSMPRDTLLRMGYITEFIEP